MDRSRAASLRIAALPLVSALALVLAGCTSAVLVTGTGAGFGTRYNAEGVLECSEKATITARGSSHTDVFEMTLLAGDCPPPTFPQDPSYCLPSDCESYTFWWPEAECEDGDSIPTNSRVMIGNIDCAHIETYPGSAHAIRHRATYTATTDARFRFEIAALEPGFPDRVLFEIEGTISRTTA